MSVLRPIWLNLAILAAFGLQADAVFSQVFNGLQRQGSINRSANGPRYFTIIGHIGHPNCYELPTSSPSLVSFVELAGNLTPTAAGPIRIVRDGRTVQSSFYSTKSTLRLVPGDIIVVDGKVNQGRIILRGNQNSSNDSTADVTLAITGIRDYPVIKTIPSERATIRWITRHLGLDERVVNSVKAITQRQSVRVLPDSRLATGTVLAFDPAMVDPSRLPDNLPVPVKAGRQAAAPQQQPMRPAGPIVQQPLTGPPSNQYGAAPGRARVPTIESAPPSSSAQTENLDIPPEEQVFVKQLLTDPSSKLLDEPTPELSGRAFVPQQPGSSRSAIDAGAANNFRDRPAAPAPSGSAIVSDSVRRPEPAASGYAPPSATESVLTQPANQPRPEMADFSPDAPRPYQSEPATPEPLQPFGSSRNALEVSLPHRESTAERSPSATPGDAGSGNSFNLAMQGATLAATAAATRSNQSSADGGPETPPPTPPASAAGGPTPVLPNSPTPNSPTPNSPSPISPQQINPVQPAQPSYPSPLRTEAAASAAENILATGSTDGSRLLPPPPSNLNWPVISILTVGFLGAVAACFLIYSIAHENPPPRSAQIDTSGRYWLDRMIENDIPIEDEDVNYPHNTQLFGKPAPIQRVDAAHRSVPRPHFSAPGGKSGVLKDNPAAPDAPSPSISDNDDTRIVRVHSGRPLRKQGAAAVPMPHSVETAAKRRDSASGLSEFAATAVFGDTAQHVDRPSGTVDTAVGDTTVGDTTATDTTATEASKTETSAAEPSVAAAKKPDRQFRLDTGHKADEKVARTSSRPAGGLKPVTVQPSQVVVKGANLLDRILSSVEHEQTVARPKADASDRNKRQSDERGNS